MRKIVDSHAHVVSERMIEDFDSVRQRAIDAGVVKVLIMCTDVPQAKLAIDMIAGDSMFDVAVGFHPTDLLEITEKDYEELEELLQHERVIALGEIGLDYYWDKVDKETQAIHFKRQIELAKKYNLPISIHMRDATKDTLDILKSYAPIQGVMHCFSGSVETMQEAVKIGMHISFAGPLTFKNSRGVPEVAKVVPADRLLSETDSPYLTPHPYRGKPNEPMYVQYVFEKLVEVRETDEESLSAQILKNYFTLFTKAKKIED